MKKPIYLLFLVCALIVIGLVMMLMSISGCYRQKTFYVELLSDFNEQNDTLRVQGADNYYLAAYLKESSKLDRGDFLVLEVAFPGTPLYKKGDRLKVKARRDASDYGANSAHVLVLMKQGSKSVFMDLPEVPMYIIRQSEILEVEKAESEKLPDSN